MRHVFPIILLAASAPAAFAQPQTRPSTCDVTIVRAPDDVRPIVQHWLDAEPHCRGSLEVRIIATEGGYYLIARDERGHTNERVVPDAQSAGVLIASWAADDGSLNTAPIAPVAPVAPPAVAPVIAPAAPMLAPGFNGPNAAPGATPVFDRPLGIDAPPPARPSENAKWLTFGGLVGTPSLGGARVELDVKRGRWWTVGFAGSITKAHEDLYDYASNGSLDMLDVKGIAYAAASLRHGPWELRGSFGLGLAYTKVDATWYYPNSNYDGGDGVFGIGELALQLGYQFGPRWGIAAGPIATIYNQSFEINNSYGAMGTTFSREADFSLFMAVRHRL